MDEWRITAELSRALGYPMTYESPADIMAEIAALTPSFADVTYETLDRLGSVQWPCNAAAPAGTPVMHVDRFVRGEGRFMITEFVPTKERTGPRFPLLLTTGRILSQYNVGAQTLRTSNALWHSEDVLEIHASDAENRGIRDGDLVLVTSRSGEVALHASISERVAPGVVYTTFHHPDTGANVITTDLSDWATNCPEYKVTAVQVRRTNGPSAWQEHHRVEVQTMRQVAAS
ncbi:MAG TPA: molybdopterin dinucleotide binding domain-containing protein [Gemmatimonadaceae bacterium]